MNELVRDLHAPVDDEYSLRCAGCDYDGYEAEAPAWPCRTADLVYTAEEIAETTSTYWSWRKWTDAARHRRALASGWGFGDDLRLTFLREVRRQGEVLDRWLALTSKSATGGAVIYDESVTVQARGRIR